MGALSVVQYVVEFLAVSASAVGFLLPRWTTLAEIKREGNVGQFSSIPYAIGAIDCFLWSIYGFSPMGNWMLIAVNMLGFCLMLYNFCKYLQHCQEEEETQLCLVLPAAGGILTVVVLLYFLSDWEKNLFFFSCVCAVSRGLTALAPLLNLTIVFREENMHSMPSLPLSAVSLLSAVLWTCYALTLVDGFVLWPSVVGIASALTQVGLHVKYKQIGQLNAGLLDD